EPSGQDGGRLAPPVGMDHQQAVGRGDVRAVSTDQRIGRARERLLDAVADRVGLLGGQPRVETVGMEVQVGDVVACGAERRSRPAGDRMAEAVRSWMREQWEYGHGMSCQPGCGGTSDSKGETN